MKILNTLISNLRTTAYGLRANQGQVMLITVLALSGTIVATTAVAGLLMLYQIRQSTDVINSTKAIFAADAGIEWQLYKYVGDKSCKTCAESKYACPPPSPFSNGATFEIICALKTDPVTNAQKVTIKSKGTSAKTSRAFEISFTPTPN